MDKKVIATKMAPEAIGPYSQAIEANGLIYTSGMIPVIPATGEIVEGIEEQAKQALEASGSNMDKVIKTTVFIKDMNVFAAVNAVYATFFTGAFPARSCVEVARLPKDVLIEVEAVALK